MKNELEIKKIKDSEGVELVSLDYEAYFDKNTGENTSFSDLFILSDYIDGIKDFRQKGRGMIKGNYGSLEITPNEFIMHSRNETIILYGKDNQRKYLNL